MGAPAFGVSMASTAMGFMGLASFDVGAWTYRAIKWRWFTKAK